jgi:hypothetical protein
MVIKFIEIQGFKKMFFARVPQACNGRGLSTVSKDKSGIMKQSLSLLCAGSLLLFLGSCFKDPPPTPVTNIAGTWEIRSSQSGMNPGITYLPGNDSLLVFTGTAYSIFSKGQSTGSGTYQIIRDIRFSSPAGTDGMVMDRIIYDGNTATVNKMFLERSGDTLTFTSGYPAIDSGFVTQYIKK